MKQLLARRALIGAVVGAIVVSSGASAFLLSAHYSQAATNQTIVTYTGTVAKSTMVAHGSKWGVVADAPNAAVTQGAKGAERVFPYRTPAAANHNGGVHAGGGNFPQVTGTVLLPHAAEGTLASNFNGLSDFQNKAIFGFHDTPPDQGLCTGFLNYAPFNGKVVIEVVNSIFGIYTTGGTLLTAFNMTSGFADPNAFSDPRCFWDSTTSSFYMTVISCVVCGPPGTADSLNDLLVVNQSGAATTYQFATNEGGTCFGDQPHTGFDADTVYIATDQFCGPDGNTYLGALLIAISKPQLAAQVPTPSVVSFVNLSLGNIPILTLEPAFGNGDGTEYLLNSFPLDQFGNHNAFASTLGFWEVHGDQNITSGAGTVTLIGRIIGSETYAFPIPAASTGTGVANGAGITSEAFLQPNDSRMLQVQLVKDDQYGLQLYAALETALTIGGDPATRDGVAWFVLNPKTHRISSQGYIGVAGAYLLMPAILHTHEGTTAISFTLTSTTTSPSAAYVVKKSTNNAFGTVQIAGAGTGAHVSFAEVAAGQGRWGDYSAEMLDPNGLDIWSATEYIGPPPGGTEPVDNWGTRVWDVTGGH